MSDYWDFDLVKQDQLQLGNMLNPSLMQNVSSLGQPTFQQEPGYDGFIQNEDSDDG